MTRHTYGKEITALLVIDPYNGFISEAGKIRYGTAFELLRKRMTAFLICCRSGMPRGRRSFGSSMHCIIDTVRATTRLGSTLRPFRRQRGCKRASNQGTQT